MSMEVMEVINLKGLDSKVILAHQLEEATSGTAVRERRGACTHAVLHARQ